MLLYIYTDGGSRWNPGESGIWVYITDKDGKALEKRYKYIWIATNNVAEYTWALYGIKRACELGACEVKLFMDSKLVIQQLSGKWKIKNEYLQKIAREIAYHSKALRIEYIWIPREENTVADALSNKAMDTKN